MPMKEIDVWNVEALCNFVNNKWEITLPYAAEMEANNALKLPIVEEEMVWPSEKKETWYVI